jgi:hypothetical protein
MEIESQPILKRFFYSTFVLTSKIFAESILQGNIGWKIVSCDCTCMHDCSTATFAATCHIKKSKDEVLQKTCMIFYSYCQKKSRDLKEVANGCVMP